MEWTHVLIALIAGVSTAVPSTILAVATLIASRNNSHKIDDNTKLTRSSAVHVESKVAEAVTVADQKQSVMLEEIKKQLNGALDTRMTEIVKAQIGPLREQFAEHNAQDERNMKEIRDALAKLSPSPLIG